VRCQTWTKARRSIRGPALIAFVGAEIALWMPAVGASRVEGCFVTDGINPWTIPGYRGGCAISDTLPRLLSVVPSAAIVAAKLCAVVYRGIVGHCLAFVCRRPTFWKRPLACSAGPQGIRNHPAAANINFRGDRYFANYAAAAMDALVLQGCQAPPADALILICWGCHAAAADALNLVCRSCRRVPVVHHPTFGGDGQLPKRRA